MPQFILNFISIIDIHIQEFDYADENGTNTTNNNGSDSIIHHNDTNYTIFNIFLNYFINNATNDTTNNETNNNITMTKFRENILKLSPLVNMIIYIITVLLTYFRIYKNKN